MVGREDVQSFLEQFHAKMKVFGIIYRDDRGKNRKAWRLMISEHIPQTICISFHLAEHPLKYSFK